jgi:hypothetical protein
MWGTTRKRALTTAGAVVGVVIVFGATASASIPSSSGTIYGCYAKSNGATRIIDPAKQKCTGTENPISWNQRGPTGPRGPQGPQGDPGSPGVAGLSGYEVVKKVYDHRASPVEGSFTAPCPAGKHVLGGGETVQLQSDEGYQGLGTSMYSVPLEDGSAWDTFVKQSATGTNPTVTVTVYATCAVTGP